MRWFLARLFVVLGMLILIMCLFSFARIVLMTIVDNFTPIINMFFGMLVAFLLFAMSSVLNSDK